MPTLRGVNLCVCGCPRSKHVKLGDGLVCGNPECLDKGCPDYRPLFHEDPDLKVDSIDPEACLHLMYQLLDVLQDREDTIREGRKKLQLLYTETLGQIRSGAAINTNELDRKIEDIWDGVASA